METAADEPPTEPLPPPSPSSPATPVAPSSPFNAETRPAFVPPSAPPKPAPPSGPFAGTVYRFTTGLRAGEGAAIRDENDRVVLTYRAFASIVGVVAALVCGIVVLAGLAGALFLTLEDAPLRASLAVVLTFAFAGFIAILVPRIQVTLYDDGQPALTISQRSIFPGASYLVSTPNGGTLAVLKKGLLSRLGRNRWIVTQDGRFVADAVEDSFGGALLRKLFGKFSRRFETDVRLEHGGLEAGRIVRRPDAQRRTDVLELTGAGLDRRVAVALATLILGKEP